MLPNPMSLANSGSMPISGGEATSGNGDQRYSGKASFGGINHKTGLNPLWLVGLAIAAAVAYVAVNRA
jgi:hypothetical protein